MCNNSNEHRHGKHEHWIGGQWEAHSVHGTVYVFGKSYLWLFLPYAEELDGKQVLVTLGRFCFTDIHTSAAERGPECRVLPPDAAAVVPAHKHIFQAPFLFIRTNLALAMKGL